MTEIKPLPPMSWPEWLANNAGKALTMIGVGTSLFSVLFSQTPLSMSVYVGWCLVLAGLLLNSMQRRGDMLTALGWKHWQRERWEAEFQHALAMAQACRDRAAEEAEKQAYLASRIATVTPKEPTA